MLRLTAEREEVRVVSDQRDTPTSAWNIASTLDIRQCYGCHDVELGLKAVDAYGVKNVRRYVCSRPSPLSRPSRRFFYGYPHSHFVIVANQSAAYIAGLPKTLPFSMRLRPELEQRLKELATLDRRTLTNYVELLFEDHVTRTGRASGTGNEGGSDDTRPARS
jgi:hypothetical protein